MLQVLGKYMVIGYLGPQGWRGGSTDVALVATARAKGPLQAGRGIQV